MSERDPGNTDKYAIFVPVGVEPADRGFTVEWLSLSSDEETEKQGAIELFTETGATSWSSEEIRPDGSMAGDRKFYFSGDKWKAPWQPQGHKPNWRTESDPTQPIN